MVKFRGVGITDEEIVYDKGEGSGVGVVAEEHEVEVLKNPCWVRRATRRSWDKRPDWGRPGTVRGHRKRERVFRGSGVEKEGDQVW